MSRRRAVAADAGQESSRKAMVSIRLSPEEEATLKAEAAAAGETLSQYVRDLLIRHKDADSEAVDYRLYPVSSTGTAGSLALEAVDGSLVPKTAQPYVSPLTPR
jgi:hypothetical protein